jgi:hypothetical protein
VLHKKVKKEPKSATYASVKKEMAKPRMAKSARIVRNQLNLPFNALTGNTRRHIHGVHIAPAEPHAALVGCGSVYVLILVRQFDATGISVFRSLAINSRLFAALLSGAACFLSLLGGENGNCGPASSPDPIALIECCKSFLYRRDKMQTVGASEFNLDSLRKRLQRMSDDELIQFGKSVGSC